MSKKNPSKGIPSTTTKRTKPRQVDAGRGREGVKR